MFDKDWLFRLARSLEGLPIIGCLEGTPAARAGIRYGDVLLSVNGKRTRSLVDYVEARALDELGMAVVVFREGREQSWELKFDAPGQAPDAARILAELALKFGAHEIGTPPDVSGVS